MKTIIILIVIFASSCFFSRRADLETGQETPAPAIDEEFDGGFLYSPYVPPLHSPRLVEVCSFTTQIRVRRHPVLVKTNPWKTDTFSAGGTQEELWGADHAHLVSGWVANATDSGSPIGWFFGGGNAYIGGEGPVVWATDVPIDTRVVHFVVDGSVDLAPHISPDRHTDIEGEGRARYPLYDTWLATEAVFNVFDGCRLVEK